MTKARRYIAWIERRTTAILVASALLVATAAALVAFHLPLHAAFSYLLPSDAPSVRAMNALGERLPARDRMVMMIVAPDADHRRAAVDRALTGLAAISPDLVESVEADDGATRDFIRAHRELYVPLADLRAVRDALRDQIAAARRRANPLFVDLDDAPAESTAVADLRARQRDANARLAKPAFVSADGRSQAIVVHTSFVATDVDRDHRLQRELDAVAGAIRADDPTIQIGFAGGVPTTVAEHHALVRGVMLSTLITGVLVAFVLLVHLRSKSLLALLVANITAATLVAFGIAALTVGHLNSATAFLGAIIAGNGVNYGILLVARFGEERHGHGDARDALAVALAGTLRPTLVASLAAAIAYGALGATSFRGFADFALIGSVGMVVCWVASFVLLPALVLRFAPTPRRATSPLFGSIVARVFSFRRPVVTVTIASMMLVGAAVVAWRYLDSDPYEYDMAQLRSTGRDAVAVRDWLHYSDVTFGRGLAGLASQTYIAVDDANDVAPVVARLHAIAKHEPIIGEISSVLDAIPADQTAKLELLGEVRDLIDQAAPELDPGPRRDLLELRPRDPASITAADLPPELLAKLRERDGRIGYIVAVKPGPTFDEADGRDLIAFAAALREVSVDGHEVTAAGGSLLFADVLLQIQRDGPLVTGLAALGLVAMVVLVVGRNRRAVAVLVAAGAGSLGMIAACALAGLKINFLDFVALPITLGLGIDYAINMAERAGAGASSALRSTGGTVLVCSLTTMIGYASLFASDNLAIRGFGLASFIGEVTCVIAALAIVPAVIAIGRAQSGRNSATATTTEPSGLISGGVTCLPPVHAAYAGELPSATSARS